MIIANNIPCIWISAWSSPCDILLNRFPRRPTAMKYWRPLVLSWLHGSLQSISSTQSFCSNPHRVRCTTTTTAIRTCSMLFANVEKSWERRAVSWPTFHGNMTDSSCLSDNISNSVCGNDEPGPVTHEGRFMVLPWLYSRSWCSSLLATGFEFWSCGWLAEWRADKWLAGSWEGGYDCKALFWNNIVIVKAWI